MTKLQKQTIKELKNNLKRLENKLEYTIPYRCPECGCDRIIKHGLRKLKMNDKGNTQRYECKGCNYKFSKRDIEFRMKNPKWKIEESLKLRKKGLSYAQISRKIGGVTRQTIMHWIEKYQPPTENKIAKVRMKNQYGKYTREFKIKV